jgi:hypothetical protein
VAAGGVATVDSLFGLRGEYHHGKEVAPGNVNEAGAHRDDAAPVRGGKGKLSDAFQRRRRLAVDVDGSGMSYSLRMGRG